MAPKSKTRSVFAAVRAAIGAELKRPYSNVLHDPIPDRMARLLKQLDQTPEGDQNTIDSSKPWQLAEDKGRNIAS